MRFVVVLFLLSLGLPVPAAAECVLRFDRSEVDVVRGELRVDLARKLRRECRGSDLRQLRLDSVTVVLDDGDDGGVRGPDRSGRGPIPIYRFFNGRQHMVSEDPDEGAGRGYPQGEGVQFSLLRRDGPNRRAVYACYVPSQNDHFLSTRPDCEGQRVERLLGYVSTTPEGPASRPLYRCYNGRGPDHIQTTDKAECVNNGYAVEPILGYVP